MVGPVARSPASRAGRLAAAAAVVLSPSVVAAQGAQRAAASSGPGPERVQLVPRDSATAYAYTQPRLLHAVTDMPAALGAAARASMRWDRAPAWLLVAGSTVVLIAADEQVLSETRRAARRVGLPPNHPSANVRVGAFKIALPTTIGSGLYFLGDGLTSVGVAGVLAARGSIADDLRARRTASEVVEALLVAGTVTQVLKHVAGRQTPSEATVPRGRWRPFPNLAAYSRNVPAYDAFPSGHLASTMATVTVLAANYPDQRLIWPVGGAAMGLLSFAMVNNGVHWASDYPLALAIGGVVGRVVAERGRTVVRTGSGAREQRAAATDRLSGWRTDPLLAPGVIGLRVTW